MSTHSTHSTQNTQNTQNRAIVPTRLSESKCHDAEHSDISHESGFSSEGNLSFLSKFSEGDHRFPGRSDHKKCVYAEDSGQDYTETDLFSSLDPSVLKPLYFEVPQSAPSVLSGRDWVFQEIMETICSGENQSRGVVVSGGPGAGKTAIVLTLVERSCFGTTEVTHEGNCLCNCSYMSYTYTH